MASVNKMLINKQAKTSNKLKKQINFGGMMQHQLNEVIFIKGGFGLHQIKFLYSHCFIIRLLNLKYAQFIEKVETLFHQAESQHFNSKMLAFFYRIKKEKQL